MDHEAKTKLREYVISIEPQNFDSSDILILLHYSIFCRVQFILLIYNLVTKQT